MFPHFNTTSDPAWNDSEASNLELKKKTSVPLLSVVQYLKKWSSLNICTNIVNQQQRGRPRTKRRKRHSLALASASHSPKHFSMAFLLSQRPTLTVGTILSGWSHCTNRFSSRKLLCSLYGMPVKKAGREDWFTPQCFSSYRGEERRDASSRFKSNHRNLSGNIFHSETYHFNFSHSPVKRRYKNKCLLQAALKTQKRTTTGRKQWLLLERLMWTLL